MTISAARRRKMLNLVRYDKIARCAKSLSPQKCSWGGFTGEFLSFACVETSFLQHLVKTLEAHHNVPMVASYYTATLSGITDAELYELIKDSYSAKPSTSGCAEIKLKELGLYCTLYRDDVAGVYAEFRVYQHGLNNIILKDAFN